MDAGRSEKCVCGRVCVGARVVWALVDADLHLTDATRNLALCYQVIMATMGPIAASTTNKVAQGTHGESKSQEAMRLSICVMFVAKSEHPYQIHGDCQSVVRAWCVGHCLRCKH